MLFYQTRGNNPKNKETVNFSYAILNPAASYGGLYAPKDFFKFDDNFYKQHLNSTYKELAFDILKKFEIDIEDNIIKQALDLYDNFDSKEPSPIVKVKDNLFVNELYHGPTRAFKDMALQPFGFILSHLAKKQNQKYLILAATSGDTGPAALETFKNKENIQVVCLYPSGGTSDVQRLQMVTNDGENLKVIGINGNFDDAQTALKELLNSNEFNNTLKEKHISLSAANSVNFGRIIFQIIYHIWSYLELLKKDEIKLNDKIYLVVPSGNFGNALGAYYAKKMGLPIEKILISANSNNVLYEWIEKGIYDLRDKKLKQTISPAMDILKSSNIERILFDKFGPERTKELLENLNTQNYFELTKEELKELQKDFSATWSSDEESKEVIKEYVKDYNYLLDPHTATCIKTYNNKREKDLKTVVCSTAEWTKFSPTILEALENKKESDYNALKIISKKLNIQIHNSIKSIFEKEIIHKIVIEKEDIQKEVLEFIN